MAKSKFEKNTEVEATSTSASEGRTPAKYQRVDKGIARTSFNYDIESEFIGFANRDSLITQHTQIPGVVNPLGRDVGQKLVKVQRATPNFSGATISVGHWNNAYHANTPGIATFWFQPIFADKTSYGWQTRSEIYKTKWIAARQLDNMVRNWQQGDMQAVDTVLMLIKMYMAIFKKVIRIMRDVYFDDVNAYYNPVAILYSMGFRGNESEIRTAYPAFWNYYNKLVGKLNMCPWLVNSIPGGDRWAAMVTPLFKDSPAKTRYTQMFHFMPRWFWALYEDEQGWYIHPMYTWDQFTELDASSLGTQYPFQGLWTFANALSGLIDTCFYDDSTQDMIATLKAIKTRGHEVDGVLAIDNLTFEREPWESDTESQIPLTFDSNMLLAVSNASILSGMSISDARIVPATGHMTQTIKLQRNESPINLYSINNQATFLAYAPKIINMPSFVVSQDDMINATQWTVCASSMDSPDPIDQGFAGGVFGTEVITNFDVIYLNPSAMNPSDPTNYRTWHVPQANIMPSAYEMQQDAASARSHCASFAHSFKLAAEFAFAPMIYPVYPDMDGSGEYNVELTTPVVQSEVYFIGDADSLAEMHNQWIRNFYGYPTFLESAQGSFSPNARDLHDSE